MNAMTRKWVGSSVAILAAVGVLAACQSMGPSMAQQVTLSGSSEVPPVTTTATGTAMVTIGDDRSVKATVTATGMTATASHIHVAGEVRSVYARRHRAVVAPRQVPQHRNHRITRRPNGAQHQGGGRSRCAAGYEHPGRIRCHASFRRMGRCHRERSPSIRVELARLRYRRCASRDDRGRTRGRA